MAALRRKRSRSSPHWWASPTAWVILGIECNAHVQTGGQPRGRFRPPRYRAPITGRGKRFGRDAGEGRLRRPRLRIGCVPSLIARSLATNRTRLIGLVANNFQNPVFLDVFDLFTRALQARGFRPLILNLTDVVDPSSSASLLKQYSVDGVIIATSNAAAGLRGRVPRCGASRSYTLKRATPRPPVHVVGVDNVAAGAFAARALR